MSRATRLLGTVAAPLNVVPVTASSWVVPAGVTLLKKAEIITAGWSVYGGNYVLKNNITVTPGATLTVHLDTGGSQCWFISSTTLQTYGPYDNYDGSGVTDRFGSPVYTTGSIGDVSYSGGSSDGRNGGGAAGPNGNGGNTGTGGGTGDAGNGGVGGNGLSGGAGSNGTEWTSTIDGTKFGSGGGGGYADSRSAEYYGGDGGQYGGGAGTGYYDGTPGGPVLALTF